MKKKVDTKGYFINSRLFSKDIIQLLTLIDGYLQKTSGLLTIFTPNPEQVVLATKDPKFAEALGSADILIPDGIGLVLGQKILSKFRTFDAVKNRITGIDLVQSLLKLYADKECTMLVVGGRDYHGRQYGNWHVRQFSELAKKEYGHEKVLWWLSGYEQVAQPSDVETNELLKAIQKLKPTIIFVALGAPNQEFWVCNNKTELEHLGVKVALVVGGTFDILLGKLDRAPAWVRFFGFEWLFRLYQEPWRWRRQLTLLQYIKLVIQEMLQADER